MARLEGIFLRLQEFDPRPIFHRLVEVPGVAGEEDGRAGVILGHAGLVRIAELLQERVIVRFDPARGVNLRRLEADRHVVFRADAIGENLEFIGSF